MKAGLLRTKLQFQHPSTVTRATNGQVLDSPWTTYYTCWGFAQPVDMDEAVEQNQLTATRIYSISMRYISGILPEDRIIFEDTYLQIKAIRDVDNRKRELKITAVVIVP